MAANKDDCVDVYNVLNKSNNLPPICKLYIFGAKKFGLITMEGKDFEELKKKLLDNGYDEGVATKIIDCYAQFLKL